MKTCRTVALVLAALLSASWAKPVAPQTGQGSRELQGDSSMRSLQEESEANGNIFWDFLFPTYCHFAGEGDYQTIQVFFLFAWFRWIFYPADRSGSCTDSDVCSVFGVRVNGQLKCSCISSCGPNTECPDSGDGTCSCLEGFEGDPYSDLGCVSSPPTFSDIEQVLVIHNDSGGCMSVENDPLTLEGGLYDQIIGNIGNSSSVVEVKDADICVLEQNISVTATGGLCDELQAGLADVTSSNEYRCWQDNWITAAGCASFPQCCGPNCESSLECGLAKMTIQSTSPDDICVLEYTASTEATGSSCEQLEEDVAEMLSNLDECTAGTGQVTRRLSDPAATKIDICVQLLVDLLLPFSEYNCWYTSWKTALGCAFVPHCCAPGVCKHMPDCGLARTIIKIISAGDVHCFKDITAGDIWNRVKERTISLTFSLLTGGLADILCEVVSIDTNAMFSGAEPLHPEIASLMNEIRAADDTSLWWSWDSAHLGDIRIRNKSSLGANEFWVQKGAITLGTLILFSDDLDYEQLALNPPKNFEGGALTLSDLRDGTITNDPSGNIYNAISTLLHEMVHVRQYTEMGMCEFYKNYLLEVSFNGYSGAHYEAEAYHYELDIVPYAVRGDYCISITGDTTGCNDPPIVEIISPNSGATITNNPGDPVTLTANVNDPDGNRFFLIFESDIQGSLCYHRYAIDSRRSCDVFLLFGTHTITATADDSLGGVGQDTITLHLNIVPPGAPTVSITSPPAGTLIWDDDPPTIFEGEATDSTGTKLTGSSLVWNSSRDGYLGTGETISVTLTRKSCDDGERTGHLITLTATDNDGLSGWDQIWVARAKLC